MSSLFLRPRPSRLRWIICVDELWDYGSFFFYGPFSKCDLICFLSCVFWLENLVRIKFCQIIFLSFLIIFQSVKTTQKTISGEKNAWKGTNCLVFFTHERTNFNRVEFYYFFHYFFIQFRFHTRRNKVVLKIRIKKWLFKHESPFSCRFFFLRTFGLSESKIFFKENVLKSWKSKK